MPPMTSSTSRVAVAVPPAVERVAPAEPPVEPGAPVVPVVPVSVAMGRGLLPGDDGERCGPHDVTVLEVEVQPVGACTRCGGVEDDPRAGLRASVAGLAV